MTIHARLLYMRSFVSSLLVLSSSYFFAAFLLAFYYFHANVADWVMDAEPTTIGQRD